MAYNTGKVNTWKKNDTFSKPTGINALIAASPALTSTPKSTSTDNTLVGPPTPKPVQSYTSSTTSGSYSGGGSSVTSQGIYDASIDAFNKQYESSKTAAEAARDQNLKALLDDIERMREDIKTRRTNIETDYRTNKKNLTTTLIRTLADIATQKKEKQDTYDTTESKLTKSIERFRDQNKLDVANQKKAYLSNQAALESAREQADRQNRIEAAARGLGGSGLQQLAQLQNLISQGQEISNVATENQSAMDALRTALTNAETDYDDDLTAAIKQRDTALDQLNELIRRNVEDYKSDTKALKRERDTSLDALDTALERAEKDYTTNVTNANTNLSNLLASYDAARATNNVDALKTLYTMVNSGSGGSSASSDLDLIVGGLQADQQDFESALSDLNKMTNKQVKKTYGNGVTKEDVAQNLYNQYLTKSNDYLRNYGNKYINQTNISADNLKNILNNYGY